MNKKQRAQVVELLRCGAYCGNTWTAAREIGADIKVCNLAYSAIADTDHEPFSFESRRDLYLEAAARVENMEWP